MSNIRELLYFENNRRRNSSLCVDFCCVPNYVETKSPETVLKLSVSSIKAKEILGVVIFAKKEIAMLGFI